jgi:hypothetical protein
MTPDHGVSIIVRTISSDIDYNAECDFAILRFSPGCLATLRQQKEAYDKLHERFFALEEMEFNPRCYQLEAVSFFDRKTVLSILSEVSPTWLDESGKAKNVLETRSYIHLTLAETQAIEAQGTAQSTEYTRLSIGKNHIRAYCVPKHTSIQVSAEDILFDDLIPAKL